MTNGYRALREGAGLLDLSRRVRIRATGEDRVRLLHALATNVIEGLRPGEGTETFFLNAQGRIQAQARVYIAADHVLLETDAQRRQTLLDYLDHYIIMDDVALEDVTGETAAFALEGPNADGVVKAALGGAPPKALHAHISVGEIALFRSTLTGGPGLWICTPRERAVEISRSLLAGSAVAVSPHDILTVRVENRVPELGIDFFDSNIPHETQQLQIVSFTKGCYTGQEIVERVRSQGRVNRLLTPIEIEAVSVPESAAAVFQGKGVGQATSLVFSPRTGKVLGFAILRREAAPPGTPITVGGAPGRTLGWTD
jgi:tRNA-modifying protein YgfZ